MVTLRFELWCIPVDQTVMQEAGMRMNVGEDKVKDLNFLLLMLSLEYVNIWSKERSDLLARTEGEEYLRAIQIKKNTQGF